MSDYDYVYVDDGDYPATAGNNRKVHLVKCWNKKWNVTLCGAITPKRPQTTQEKLPKCKRCFNMS